MSTPATPFPGLDRTAVVRLVHGFYDDVRADPLLGPTFDAVLAGRWDTHLPRMVEFWSTMVLGTRSFSGNVFGKHMVLEGISPRHFEHWLRLWFARTSRQFDAATAGQLQTVALGIARNLHRGYFGDDAGFARIERELHHVHA